jgi:hypothetical protein
MTDLEIITQVREYEGKNNFINSLKGGLTKWGRLTPKQISAAGRVFQSWNKTEPKVMNNGGGTEVNVNIKVTKFIAKRIAQENELEFRPFLLTISKVLKETEKAYQVVGKMNLSDVSSCRCCGRDLTDWRSQATGIGPVCSKHLGIPYVQKQEDVEVYMKLLSIKINKIGDLTFWLAKSQIVEGKEEMIEALKK